MTQLIDPRKYTSTVNSLRSFFLDRGFAEVHTQNRLSILAACEDPFNVATYNYAGEVWPLPQTGQMWLEHELLKSPSSEGFFCISTSYRQEPNAIPGRHDIIFPMFEFESHGDMKEMMAMEKSRSITLDDLDVIPPRNTIDDVPESFTSKDVGFSTRPERSIENIGEEKFAGNINLTKINEPDEIKDIINKIATDNDSFLDARRNVVKFGSKGENLEALARDLGLSDATLFKRK